MSLEPTPEEQEIANAVTAKRTLQNYLTRIDGLVERAALLAGTAKLTALQDALDAFHDVITNALPLVERVEQSREEVLADVRRQYNELGVLLAELEGDSDDS